MDKKEKVERGLTLFIESVLKPDSQLRQCAHNQECYYELLEWREDVLEYLYRRQREIKEDQS